MHSIGTRLGLVLSLALLGANVSASPASILPLGLPAVPDKPVTDLAGMLSPAVIENLNDAFYRTRNIGGFQLRLLTLADLHGQAIEAVAESVAQAWNPGKDAAGKGVLILMAQPGNQVQIVAGPRLTGRLDGASCLRIAREAFRPRLRMGDPNGAAVVGASALAAQLGVDLGITPGRLSGDPSSYRFLAFLPWIAGAGLLLAVAAVMSLNTDPAGPWGRGFRVVFPWAFGRWSMPTRESVQDDRLYGQASTANKDPGHNPKGRP